MIPLYRFKRRKKTGMSIHAELLLDLIYMESKTVMKVMEEAIEIKIATYSTIHRSLMWLKENGYISITRSDEDTRQKKCSATEKGRKYLSNEPL